MAQTTLLNVHSNEYRQKLRYYPFAVNLDRYAGCYNTLANLSSRVYVFQMKQKI